jgi:hypothetical protein
MSPTALWTPEAPATRAQGELGSDPAVRGAAPPGGEALGAGHHRAAGDQLDDQAQGLKHAAGALDGRQRYPHQLDEAGVGGSTVAAGAVVGEVGHAAGHRQHGVGVDMMGSAEVPAFGEGAANLDV